MTRRLSGRGIGRRIAVAGIVVGALVGGMAAALPAAAATNPAGLPAVPQGIAALPHNRLPAHSVLARGPLPKIGSHGAAFQAPNQKGAKTPDIVGGTLANSADFPYVVGIETQFIGEDSSGNAGWYIAYCTGTIIAPTKVLTAGHCDTDLPDGSSVVIAGRNNLDTDSGGTVVGVASTWTDPNFNLAALNTNPNVVPLDDVAVLTLKQALPSNYPAISLTGQGDQSPYAPGTNGTIVGYGITSPGSQSVGTLYQAQVPIQSDTTCAAAMPGYDGTRMTCAGQPSGGVDSCNGDSGGPLLVNGVEAAITDWGSVNCGQAGTYGVYERLSTYDSAVTGDISRPLTTNLDWTGDGHSDLLARDGSGALYLYAGSGFSNDGYGGFTGRGQIGTGWNGFTTLFRVTNWTGNGTESVLAENAQGTLFEYDSDGYGNWTNAGGNQIGTGWNSFTNIMVVNNWTGDGHEDLLGRTPQGQLRLYESNGQGGWVNAAGTQIGTGWNEFNTILTPDNWAGDGHAALIGRTPQGQLRLYESDGQGGWINAAGTQIGAGWNEYSTMFTVGDWSGDGLIDVLALTPDGRMFQYTTDGHGNWITGQGQQIGSGWQSMTAIF